MPLRNFAKADTGSIPVNKPANPTAGSIATGFAAQLAAFRADSGETQRQLAGRLGMTESMISRLESGAHIPSLTTLCRIADAFGRRLELVFHDHSHEHPGGIRHTHPHRHAASADDYRHDHDHEARPESPAGEPPAPHAEWR